MITKDLTPEIQTPILAGSLVQKCFKIAASNRVLENKFRKLGVESSRSCMIAFGICIVVFPRLAFKQYDNERPEPATACWLRFLLEGWH
jgi:hypothetical protein